MNDDGLVQKIRDLYGLISLWIFGHTKVIVLKVFAQKPAPVVSISWLGYGYTTGLSAIDYFLG